ncbi:MAG: cache domain-containing protein [Candidatus Marinimicrobia bacterium]|nr:cache domain-containing protein [Candidatus Neomarinimicrobiota bacterium]
MKRFITIALVLLLVLLSGCCLVDKKQYKADMDLLIKSEVETAVSLLEAVYNEHLQSNSNLEDAKTLAANLLRDLRYGDDGYFWADTKEGVNVVLYGRKDVEGRNRLEDKDPNGVYYVKGFIKIAQAGGGYFDYSFVKLGETEPQAKRSYVKLFEPFGWVVGSGYYK